MKVEDEEEEEVKDKTKDGNAIDLTRPQAATPINPPQASLDELLDFGGISTGTTSSSLSTQQNTNDILNDLLGGGQPLKTSSMLLPDDLLGVGPNSTQNPSGIIHTYGGIGVPASQKQVSYSLEGMFGGGGFSLGQTTT